MPAWPAPHRRTRNGKLCVIFLDWWPMRPVPTEMSQFLTALVAVAAVLSSELAAQRNLGATGRQDLDFGMVIPGVPTIIDPVDRRSNGQFEVRGQRRAEVEVRLTLPAALRSTVGPVIPLQFGAGDAAFSRNRSIRNAQYFDPRTALVTRLGFSGRLFVFLGGTALPPAQLAQGEYTAQITLTVAYTGS